MNLIGYLGVDIQFARLRNEDRQRGMTFINMYDLPYLDLSQYQGIIITNYVDENFMVKHRSVLENYLNNGGVVFNFAEMTYSYLPNAPIWTRSPIAIKDREFIIAKPEHELFAGVNAYDLNYRKGVKGFLTRGQFNELPKEAEVLMHDQQMMPILYIDRNSTKGTIINGSGTDIYQMYREDDTTANRFASQILSFMKLEAQRLEEAKGHEPRF